jgi:hypothetical protein
MTDHEQVRYLKLRADGLCQHEKFVILQVDEMHVNRGFNCKSGRITGVTESTKNEQANALQAFLIISSIAGNMHETVALVLVKQSTSSALTDMMKKVINVMQAYGFNNQINAKAFEQL